MLYCTEYFSDETGWQFLKNNFFQVWELYLALCLLQHLSILFCMLVWKEIKQPRRQIAVCVCSIHLPSCFWYFVREYHSWVVDSGWVRLFQVSGYGHSFEMSGNHSPITNWIKIYIFIQTERIDGHEGLNSSHGWSTWKSYLFFPFFHLQLWMKTFWIKCLVQKHYFLQISDLTRPKDLKVPNHTNQCSCACLCCTWCVTSVTVFEYYHRIILLYMLWYRIWGAHRGQDS